MDVLRVHADRWSWPRQSKVIEFPSFFPFFFLWSSLWDINCFRCWLLHKGWKFPNRISMTPPCRLEFCLMRIGIGNCLRSGLITLHHLLNCLIFSKNMRISIKKFAAMTHWFEHGSISRKFLLEDFPLFFVKLFFPIIGVGHVLRMLKRLSLDLWNGICCKISQLSLNFSCFIPFNWFSGNSFLFDIFIGWFCPV